MGTDKQAGNDFLKHIVGELILLINIRYSLWNCLCTFYD